MKMDSFLGKKILATVRSGDFAHPGEEEAVELLFASIPKNPAQKILDAGCGRGGTADYLYWNGWGIITAIDSDPESINYAQLSFPGIDFIHCDVLNAPAKAPGPFDIICLFNSFYAFENQPGALKALAGVAATNCRLALFDYFDKGGYQTRPITNDGKNFIQRPLQKKSIIEMLKTAGWTPQTFTDISLHYAGWYENFMANLKRQKAAVISIGGEEAYENVGRLYSELLASINKGDLGGAIIRALKA